MGHKLKTEIEEGTYQQRVRQIRSELQDVYNIINKIAPPLPPPPKVEQNQVEEDKREDEIESQQEEVEEVIDIIIAPKRL